MKKMKWLWRLLLPALAVCLCLYLLPTAQAAGSYWFYPAKITIADTELKYTLVWEGSGSGLLPAGNVLTIRDDEGAILGTSTSFIPGEQNNLGGEATGELTLTAPLSKGVYQVWLNDAPTGATLMASDEVEGGFIIPMIDWNGNFYSNYGIFPMSLYNLNAGETGEFLIRDMAMQYIVLRSGVLTGVRQSGGRYDGYLGYHYDFTTEEMMAALQDGRLYSICFVDGNGKEDELAWGYWSSSVSNPSFGENEDSFYFEQSIMADEAVAGSAELKIRIYSRGENGMVTNAEVSALEKVKQLRFVHLGSGETWTVVSYTHGWDEYYYYVLTLTLDKPLQGGAVYGVYLNENELTGFNVKEAEVPPTAPGSVSVTDATTTSLTLSWTAGASENGVSGYDIYLDGEKYCFVPSEDALSATVEGLEPGREYEFSVYSVDRSGNRSQTAATVTGKTVGIIIDTSDIAESYVMDIYRDKQILVSISVAYESASDMSDLLDLLQKGAIFWRRQGTSDWTEEALRNAGSGRLNGYWTISGDDDGYLTPGVYEVRFSATDYYGVTVTSEVLTVQLKVEDKPPQAPGSVTVTAATTGSVTLSWTAGSDLNEDGTAGSGVMGYDVYVDGKEVVRLTSESTLSYTVTGLEQGREYEFGVYTRDKAGNISLTAATVTGKTVGIIIDTSSLDGASYVMDEEWNKKISVRVGVSSDLEGYTPWVDSASVQWRKQGDEAWSSYSLHSLGSGTAGGLWPVHGDDHGFLPPGAYEVRFIVTDEEGATATSEPVLVQLKADEEPPEVAQFTPDGRTVRGEGLELYAYAIDNVEVEWIKLSYAPAGSEDFTVIAKLEVNYGAVHDVPWEGADQLPDGDYTIRVIAIDQRGNEGVKDYTLTLDNTPPAAPVDPAIRGTSRVIMLQWSEEKYEASEDFYCFNVYRAESPDGPFELCSTSYINGSYTSFDNENEITADKDYYYYVTAEDWAGNESAPEPVLSARIVSDKQSPVITACRPAQSAQVRGTAQLQVTATDNYKLARAVFSYKLEGESRWTEIAEVNVTEALTQHTFLYDWKIPQEVYGKAQLRVQVWDDSIHDEETLGAVYGGYQANAAAEQIVDITILPSIPPASPVLSATAEYKLANLSWTYSGEVSTLRHFVVYRVNNDGSYDYVTTVAAGVSGRCAVAIPKTGAQLFVVQAVDKVGETADSNQITVTSAAGDTEKPVARITPEQLTAAMGHAYTFSGAGSTDNGGISSWKWDFGDGATGEGVTCSHTYEAAGSYTVSLTVEDEYDNVSTTTATVTVHDLSDGSFALATFAVVNAAEPTTPAVAGAQITVTAAGGFTGGGVTDEKGEVTLLLPAGAVSVTVMAEGYMAISRQVAVKPDDDGLFRYRMGATPTNVSLVDGKLTQERMSYDEIVAAGIDPSDPDNEHVWEFKATLEFVAGLRAPFTIPVEGLFNAEGYMEGSGGGWGWHSYGGGGDGGGTGYAGLNIGVFPLSERFLLVIYGEAHWLKEMYNVELLVINNSYVDDITDCVATLSLPEGLSLASMVGEQQSARVELGTIAHKTGEGGKANTAKCNWYVRGDKAGEYNLSATVTGNSPDPFIRVFETDQPVKVYAGDALHLTIKAQEVAFFGKDYKVTFTLTNVSDIDLYNLSFGLTGVEQYKAAVIGPHEGEILLGHEDFGDDKTYSLDVMHPGDYITIELTTNCLFYSVLEAASEVGLVDLGPMEVAYYLTGIFVTTLEGSSTSIPYSTEIEEVPHSTFFEYQEGKAEGWLNGKVISLVDKLLFDKVPIVANGVKLYKTATKIDQDIDAKVKISVNGGEVVESGGSRSRSASTGAIKVYTDAAPGDYEISADGKTLILKADADVYVEGVQDGEATVTVTTHVKNLQTGEYEPNVYELLYQVGEAASWPHVRDAKVQEQNGSWTFTGELLDYDETVNVVFALYDDAGRMVGVTSQTIAANATDRALQCVAKANGVASVKMFLLGSTGVPLAMEKILK